MWAAERYLAQAVTLHGCTVGAASRVATTKSREVAVGKMLEAGIFFTCGDHCSPPPLSLSLSLSGGFCRIIIKVRFNRRALPPMTYLKTNAVLFQSASRDRYKNCRQLADPIVYVFLSLSFFFFTCLPVSRGK